MSRDAGVGLVAVLGALVAKLVTSGRYLDYVRHRMAVPLLAAAFSLLAVAVVAMVCALAAGGERGPPAPPGLVSHHARGRAGILIVVPIVLLAAVPPAPLGAFAAATQPAAWRAPSARSLFPPLPKPAGGAVPMSMSDFVSRALYDPAGSLRGVTVRLVAFAAGSPESTRSGSYVLVRFAIYCCAADAVALRVRIRGAQGPRPPPDTWLEVTGRWRPAPPLAPGAFDPNVLPTLDAATVRIIQAPADPYDAPV